MIKRPYYLENKEWYTYDEELRRDVLTDKAPQEAIDSYYEFYNILNEECKCRYVIDFPKTEKQIFNLEKRKEILEKALIDVSQATALFYYSIGDKENDEQYWPTMKLYILSGTIFFVNKSRKMEITKIKILFWDRKIDMPLIYKICNGDNFICSEYDDDECGPSLTISLKNKR